MSATQLLPTSKCARGLSSQQVVTASFLGCGHTLSPENKIKKFTAFLEAAFSLRRLHVKTYTVQQANITQ
jgi:hypothetical protein